MKIFTILCVFFANVMVLAGQSTINRTDIFIPGDVLYHAGTLNTPDPGPGGANAEWDFTGIQIDSQLIAVVNIGESDTTAHGAEFPNSNVAVITGFGGFQFVQYLDATSDRIDVVGEIIPGFIDGRTTYSDPQTILQFPLTYQSSWEDDFAYILEYTGSGISYDASGNTQCRVDGHGTLRLPHVTFDNAIRLEMITFSFDTVSFGSETESNETFDTTYIWLSSDYPGVLCVHTSSRTIHTAYFVTADTVISDSETIISTSFSLDPFSDSGGSVARVTPGRFSLSASPNPFDRSLVVTFSTDQFAEMEFVLRDIHGREVYRTPLEGYPGEVTTELQIPDLPGGMYLALLQSETGADVLKLIRL